MASTLGITLGGMADARETRLSRELQERALGLQETLAGQKVNSELRTQANGVAQQFIKSVSEISSAQGPEAARPVAELAAKHITSAYQGVGLDPSASLGLLEAAVSAGQSPEARGAAKAEEGIASARAVAQAAQGASEAEKDAMIAAGFLPSPDDQWRTLDNAEKAAMGFAPASVVQQNEQTGEVSVKQGEQSVNLRQATDTLTGQKVFATESDIISNPDRFVPVDTAPVVTIDQRGNEVGNPPKDMAWVFETGPDGQRRVKLDERGAPIALPIKGTKLFNEGEEAERGRKERERQASLYADVVTDEIDRSVRLIAEADIPVTGAMGFITSAIPGTPAFDLSQNLETIKANIGFDKLQAMRDNSPTGGAIGQVSNFEQRLLQATFGSVQQSQTKEQLLYNLNRIRQIYRDVVVRGVNPEEVQAGRYAEGDTGAVTIGTVEEFGDQKFMYMGGDPGVQRNWWSIK